MLEQQWAQQSIEKRIRQGNFSFRSDHLFMCEDKMPNHLYGIKTFHYAGAVACDLATASLSANVCEIPDTSPS